MAAVEDLDGGADGPREGRRGEEGAEGDGADAEAEAVVELPEEDREERRVLEEIGRADRRAIARVPLRQPRVAEHVRAQRLDQPRPQRRRVAHHVPSERLGPRHTRLRDACVRSTRRAARWRRCRTATLDHPGGPLAAAAHAAAEARGEGGGLRRRRGAGGDRQEIGVIVDPILLAAVDADLGRKVVVTPERLQRRKRRQPPRAAAPPLAFATNCSASASSRKRITAIAFESADMFPFMSNGTFQSGEAERRRVGGGVAQFGQGELRTLGGAASRGAASRGAASRGAASQALLLELAERTHGGLREEELWLVHDDLSPL